MGKLEKFGRSILRKLGGSRRRRGDAPAAATSSSASSDEETSTLTPQTASRSLPDMYIHKFQVVPPEDDVEMTKDPTEPLKIKRSKDQPSKEYRQMGSPAASDEGSAGYATDDTALSSISPLEIKRSSVDYSESQGYYSTAELSPIPRIVLEEAPEAPTSEPETPKTPLFKKNPSQEYPRINVSKRFKSSLALSPDPSAEEGHLIPIHPKIDKRKSATLTNLADPLVETDPVERFLKSSIYKTKMITTVFEAKDGRFEEICTDVMHEIDRWFETKNMMAVACEMHWSVPREKRNRQLESRLKDKLLQALRENNKRLLYLRGMGRGKTPVKLAESRTVENISRDRETDSVRGIYQRSYTRLLPYLHKETPEWHSQYWTLQDLQNLPEASEGFQNQNLHPNAPSSSSSESTLLPDPQHFLFNSEAPDVLAKNSLISLNIIGLSILGNSRKSCGSLFEQGLL